MMPFEPEPEDLSKSAALDAGVALELRNVSVKLGGKVVVRGANVRARFGRVTAVIGPNGAGKSTLIKCALGLVRANEGEVLWSGAGRIQNIGVRQMAKVAGYLAQGPTYPPGSSVRQVLELGRYAESGWFGVESESDARAVMKCAELLGVADLLGRGMDSLSGGQRQRVLIARAMMQQAVQGVKGGGEREGKKGGGGALLLDEPDTYLDLAHLAELAGVLRMLAREQGKAVVLASHDLTLAQAVADDAVLMQDGAVKLTGPADEVLTDQNLSELYGVRFCTVNVNEKKIHVPVL